MSLSCVCVCVCVFVCVCMCVCVSSCTCFCLCQWAELVLEQKFFDLQALRISGKKDWENRCRVPKS